MPRTNYQRGADKERRIVNYLKKQGYVACRSAGSLGLFDVIALHPEKRIIRLIQAKLPHLSKNAIQKILKEGEHLNGAFVCTFEYWGKYGE